MWGYTQPLQKCPSGLVVWPSERCPLYWSQLIVWPLAGGLLCEIYNLIIVQKGRKAMPD